MIQPIVAYGSPILRRACSDVPAHYYGLGTLLADMWETMENADGVGLAAPQIGVGLRIFVVDSTGVLDSIPIDERASHPYFPGIRQAFINARILAYGSATAEDIEGCLSIPGILQPVRRAGSITLRYLDENFNEHTAVFCGMTAQMIQHEYDHTEGKLYLDYLSPFRLRTLQKTLDRIARGQIRAPYPMVFG